MTRSGCPKIFNTDRGAQFTSTVFTDYLLAHGIRISEWPKAIGPRRGTRRHMAIAQERYLMT